MRGRYTDYKEIYNNWRKAIKGLGGDLTARALDFYDVSILGIKVSDIAYAPNRMQIEDVVLNTIVDIDRIKKYHPVDNPARYKYAAYVGFWWQRSKPFSCKIDDYRIMGALSEKLVLLDNSAENRLSVVWDICKSINEIFICDFILQMIQIPSGQSILCDANRKKMMDYCDLKDSLEYFLRYRRYDAQGLELFLKGLNTCPIGVGAHN